MGVLHYSRGLRRKKNTLNSVPFNVSSFPTESSSTTQTYTGFTTVPGINVFAVYAAGLASPYGATFTVGGNSATVRAQSVIGFDDSPLWLVEYNEGGAGGAASLLGTFDAGSSIYRCGAGMWQLGSGYSFVTGSDVDGGADYGTGYSDPLSLTPPNTANGDVIFGASHISDGGYVEGDMTVTGFNRKDIDGTFNAGRFMQGAVMENATAGASVAFDAGLAGNATFFGLAAAWRPS